MAIRARPDLDLFEFHGMVTVAPEMKSLFGLLERVAQTEASVLLRGETGTGKELAAAAIHELSPRAAAAFRGINCATLTPELAASELFGHVRGAFTGAVSNRAGLFAQAEGGTVFLDEVGEVPLEIQGRLLGVLQEDTFVPVGGTQPRKANIRLLTATNKSLRDLVEAGRFRDDLMYRIRVVPVFMPPLVEREGDVEALAWYFIDHFNKRAETGHRRVESFEQAAFELLSAYPWPGNVRELRNVIEYAFAVGDGPTIRPEELPPELRGELAPQRTEGNSPEEEERERIAEALRIAGGAKAHAAELLGISRTTLWRRMRELKLL